MFVERQLLADLRPISIQGQWHLGVANKIEASLHRSRNAPRQADQYALLRRRLVTGSHASIVSFSAILLAAYLLQIRPIQDA